MDLGWRASTSGAVNEGASRGGAYGQRGAGISGGRGTGDTGRESERGGGVCYFPLMHVFICTAHPNKRASGEGHRGPTKVTFPNAGKLLPGRPRGVDPSEERGRSRHAASQVNTRKSGVSLGGRERGRETPPCTYCMYSKLVFAEQLDRKR